MTALRMVGTKGSQSCEKFRADTVGLFWGISSPVQEVVCCQEKGAGRTSWAASLREAASCERSPSRLPTLFFFRFFLRPPWTAKLAWRLLEATFSRNCTRFVTFFCRRWAMCGSRPSLCLCLAATSCNNNKQLSSHWTQSDERPTVDSEESCDSRTGYWRL